MHSQRSRLGDPLVHFGRIVLNKKVLLLEPLSRDLVARYLRCPCEAEGAHGKSTHGSSGQRHSPAHAASAYKEMMEIGKEVEKFICSCTFEELAWFMESMTGTNACHFSFAPNRLS